jgi:hypothetical protein
MLTSDERIWVIENYRALGGVTACVNDWPFESAAPNKSTVSRLISRFKLTGSVMNRKQTGRPKTATTGDDLEEVRVAVLANPNTSVARFSLELGKSRTSTFRNLKKLELKAYHPTEVQELLPEDYEKR